MQTPYKHEGGVWPIQLVCDSFSDVMELMTGAMNPCIDCIMSGQVATREASGFRQESPHC